MTKFLLWSALVALTGNPLLALVVVAGLVWVAEGRVQGRLWSPWPTWERWRRIRVLRATVAANPANLPAHAELGRLLVQSGGHAGAIPHLERAIQGMPASAEPRFFLGSALLALGRRADGQQQVAEALAIRADLLFGEPHRVLGVDHAAHGEWEPAVAHLQDLVRIRTSSSEGHARLGEALLALHRVDEARDALREAILAYDQSPRKLRRGQWTWRWRAWWRLRDLGR